MTERGKEWEIFSKTVWNHIEDYTVPQYGDWPDDAAENYTPRDCIKQIEKYASRFGKNQRGEEEQKRDILKIAHYACIIWGKL